VRRAVASSVGPYSPSFSGKFGTPLACVLFFGRSLTSFIYDVNELTPNWRREGKGAIFRERQFVVPDENTPVSVRDLYAVASLRISAFTPF
jgi:hypothetical protein